MLASSTSGDPSPLEVVASILDEIGKAIPPQIFQRLLSGAHPPGSPSTPNASELFGFRMTFVLDSCSLQGALRQQLKHGKSGVLNGIRAGFLRPIAPRQLDREIRRHLREIAADCHVPLDTARALYREVATLIDFKPVSPAKVRRLKREMPNPEDAAFVALLFETEALGVVTEEKAYASIPGVRAYSAADAGRIVLCYRKQATVFVCSIPMVRMALDLVSQLVGAIVRFVRQFPQLAVAVVLGVLAFAAMYPERARKALDAARTACADLWTLVGPHLIAFGTVAQTRLVEAAETRQRLTAVRATVA
jgi:hypothetical protein